MLFATDTIYLGNEIYERQCIPSYLNIHRAQTAALHF